LGNIVDSTFDFVEATFDFVAFDNADWISLMVWTGFKTDRMATNAGIHYQELD